MWSMAGGLVAGYGTFVSLGGQFVYPSKGRALAWQYVSRLADMAKGDAIDFTAPDGAKIVVARLGDGETTRDFIALSSVCPHLGCQVHWELANDRFFCPCHNGAFDAQGNPTEGPPAQDGRALAQYPLEIRDGLLFIEVPTEGLNRAQSAAANRQNREV
jgi:Rieske Fe-S protein